jgi:phage terminase large subunit
MALAAVERGHVRDKMNRFERRAIRGAWSRVAGAYVRSGEVAGVDYSQYHDDPVGFFRDVLGIELWSRQAEIAMALVRHEQVAAKTGHKIGKSLLASGLAYWWACTRPGSLVIITAPSAEQVKDIIWKEMRLLHKRLRDKIGGVMPLDPMTGLHMTNGSIVKGLATNTPERVAGRSGQSVFVVIDEASGYPDTLYEALETSAAGGDDELEGAGEAKILAIGNPTQTSGWFFDIFRTANPDWSRHTVSSEETPNVIAANDNGGGHRVIPGLATLSFINKLRRKYGPDPDTHPVYMVRVKGLYPERSSNSVVALSDVDKATSEARRARTRKPPAPYEATLGVDVARFGDDDSAIASCIENWTGPMASFSGLNGPHLAAEVLKVARVFIAEGRRVRVNVDGNGVGASVLDALIAFDEVKAGKMYVVDIQAGAKPDLENEDNYFNLRSQMWFGLATYLAEGGTLPDDGELERECLAPTYRVDEKGKIRVAGKDEIKKVLGRSPDLADAMCLAVYRGRRAEYRYDAAKPDPQRHDTRPIRTVHGWRGGGGASF